MNKLKKHHVKTRWSGCLWGVKPSKKYNWDKLREDISTLDGDFTTQTNRVKTIKTVHFIWGMAGLSILFLILNNIQRQ